MKKPLSPGLYEQVINNELARLLRALPAGRKDEGPIDTAEAPTVLTEYLTAYLRRALAEAPADLREEAYRQMLYFTIWDDSLDRETAAAVIRERLAALAENRTLLGEPRNKASHVPQAGTRISSAFPHRSSKTFQANQNDHIGFLVTNAVISSLLNSPCNFPWGHAYASPSDSPSFAGIHVGSAGKHNLRWRLVRLAFPFA